MAVALLNPPPPHATQSNTSIEENHHLKVPKDALSAQKSHIQGVMKARDLKQLKKHFLYCIICMYFHDDATITETTWTRFVLL